MHVINTKDLKGNEILAKDIVNNSDIVLICKGTVLKKEYKIKLLQLGIESVIIKDQIDSGKYAYLSEEKLNIIDSTKSLVKNLIEQHIYRDTINITKLCDTIQSIITDMICEDEIFEQIINVKQESADLYTHSVNVCILSTLVALKLKLAAEKVLDIARGSMLHDIGLRYVTTVYENVNIDLLSEKARKEYKKHVLYGYEAVANLVTLSAGSKKIILHHHETFDGKGFPFRLKGDRMPYEAKIVAVCDAFDRKRTGIGETKTKINEIIEYLKIHKNILYDDDLVELLLSIVAVYPIGTKVLTNENKIGIVIRQNKSFSERPVVMLIEDDRGMPINPPREMDLLKVLNVYIKDVLN